LKGSQRELIIKMPMQLTICGLRRLTQLINGPSMEEALKSAEFQFPNKLKTIENLFLKV